MARAFFIAGVILAVGVAHAQTPDAGEIARRAAENLDRAEEARKSYVYDQEVFVRMLRGHGKLAREETRKYVVTPSATGATRELKSVQGTVIEGSKSTSYTTAGFRTHDRDIDGGIVNSIARELAWRKNAVGIVGFMFPLSVKNLGKYAFRFEGEERYNGYDAFRISWHPAAKRGESHDSDWEWEGEALIERNEYQPILVTTHWIGKIPRAVAIALGTDVSQLGAKITYQRMEQNVWFPVSMGGEMKLRVLFLYGRTVAFRATASEFHKTDVQSSVEFEH